MADPKKLEAWVNGGGKGSPAPKGGSKPGWPPAKGGAPPAEPEESEGQGEEDEDLPEDGEGDDTDVMEKYGEVMEQLQTHAEEIGEQIDLLDPGVLSDPGAEVDDGTRSVLDECLASLDQSLVDAMREHLTGVPYDDAMDIAEHLADEGAVAEPEPFAGFLFQVGQIL